jgi:hypothetical protein
MTLDFTGLLDTGLRCSRIKSELIVVLRWGHAAQARVAALTVVPELDVSEDAVCYKGHQLLRSLGTPTFAHPRPQDFLFSPFSVWGEAAAG